MKETMLIVGGAGFVGSNLALSFKKDYPGLRIVAMDNLRRRGSELNIPRLTASGIVFSHGDIRNQRDLEEAGGFDMLIDCAAEPSVLAGYGSSPAYLLQANLNGALNCFEQARRYGADVVFLSTSRVYPFESLRKLVLEETGTRFELAQTPEIPGVSPSGINESFPLEGLRSIYGATKLAAELILREYSDAYDLNAIINRCGVLTGPWQMGQAEQGIVSLWVAGHLFGGALSYIGYGGGGKQVRDILHVQDLYNLLRLQLNAPERFKGRVFNVGGGRQNAVSLLELTQLCRKITGRQTVLSKEPETRPADIPWFVTDSNKIGSLTGWQPRIPPEGIVEQIADWMGKHQSQLASIFKV